MIDSQAAYPIGGSKIFKQPDYLRRTHSQGSTCCIGGEVWTLIDRQVDEKPESPCLTSRFVTVTVDNKSG